MMPQVKVLNGEHKGKVLDTTEICWVDDTVTCRLENGGCCELRFEDVEVIEDENASFLF